MLHSLVYVSTAVDAMSHKSLSSLSEQASARNDSLGVTGLLLYSDRKFMQCLEGSKESIDVLMKSITSDRRHSGLLVLFENEISNREFAEWGMAAVSPDAGFTAMVNAQQIGDWLTTSFNVEKNPGRFLLTTFYQRER